MKSVLAGLLVALSVFASTVQGKIVLHEMTDWTGNTRTIRVYLPPDYTSSNKHYPVLYMHDAQNLFDPDTAYAGEWQVDETLDRLATDQGLTFIVIGIDHGGKHRLAELSPWTNARFGEAAGEQYSDFIVKTLKPWADANYRTLPGREHTAVIGSSMGGLMSHYMALQYPQVFSKAAIFSPSYWYSDKVYTYTQQHLTLPTSRLFLLVGGKEGGDMQQDMLAMYQLTQAYGQSSKNVIAYVDAEAQHNEAFWRNWFATAVKWLFEVN